MYTHVIENQHRSDVHACHRLHAPPMSTPKVSRGLSGSLQSKPKAFREKNKLGCYINPPRQTTTNMRTTVTVLHIVTWIGCGDVKQIAAPPSNPLLGVAGRPHHTVAHLAGTDVGIIRENQWCVVSIDFFKQDKLLPFLASFNQMLLLAARFAVYTRLRLTHDDVVEPRVQHPASCAGTEWSLHNTDLFSFCQKIFFTSTGYNLRAATAVMSGGQVATHPMILRFQQWRLHEWLFSDTEVPCIAVSRRILVPALHCGGRV